MADEILIRLCGNSIIATREDFIEQAEAKDAWKMLYTPAFIPQPSDEDEWGDLSFWPYMD